MEGEVPLHLPRAFTWGPGPVFRGLPGLLSTCLWRPDRATPCPQSPQKWGQVPAGPHLSEASAESSHWRECWREAELRKCQRVNGVLRPWPSKLPPTQACQTPQEKSSRCVSFFTCLMAEKSSHPSAAHGAGADQRGSSRVPGRANPMWV